MRIIYRNQLPGEQSKVKRYKGWLAVIVGILLAIVLIAVVVILFSFVLTGILIMLALGFILLIIGWIWLGFKIGFRNLWDFTTLFFSISFGRHTDESRRERIMNAWEKYRKGRPGKWVK